MDVVLALVLAAHLFDQLPPPGLNLDAMWVHSIAVATLAKAIAMEEGGNRSKASTSGIAGLLHDLGELIFLANNWESYYAMVRRSNGDEQLLLQMELEQFGVGHPELGAHILSLWGLPEEVVQAVAYHHGSDIRPFEDVPLASKAVCIAEWLLQAHNREDEPASTDTFLEDYLSKDFDSLEKWKKILDRLVEQGMIQNPHNPTHDLFG